MEEVIRKFSIAGDLVMWDRFGQGHINDTFIFTCNTGVSYILQKISPAAFKRPDELMSNVSAVCAFLEKKLSDHRASMHLSQTKGGDSYYVDENGDSWRVYEFVRNSICLQKAECPEELYRTGLAFGHFQRYLSDFPTESLYETIPDFHNTPVRYAQLREAISKDVCGRAGGCAEEIDFALSREDRAGEIVDAMAAGRLPVRVTHNDTKLNNILLDYDTHEPLCVIDLDTVMPGSSLYDFGDLIRFGASTAAEDERDLGRVRLDERLFATAAAGYLCGCGDTLTETEKAMLPTGALLMTLECGVRFLADYLCGDKYFKIERETHNLDRARTQFKLVRDMERKWQRLHELVTEAEKQIKC